MLVIALDIFIKQEYDWYLLSPFVFVLLHSSLYSHYITFYNTTTSITSRAFCVSVNVSNTNLFLFDVHSSSVLTLRLMSIAVN